MKAVQMFRPGDISRVIETASRAGHPTRADIRMMALDSLRVLVKRPQGECRDQEIAAALQTFVEAAEAGKRGRHGRS